jgi:predicted O-methyltransferase YrrM
MYSALQLAVKYACYLLTAENGRGHGIHSPFVFEFIRDVLRDKKKYDAYTEIEALRRNLRGRKEVLEVEDFGAGSVAGSKKERSIAEIARLAAKPSKYGKLLYRMVARYQPVHVIELGTSLGLSTAYLASANPAAQVYTLEGSEAIAEEAGKNFSVLDLKNIHIYTGNFDHTLEKVLNEMQQADFAFIDGNHRKEPTEKYFEQLMLKCSEKAILVFDDIHWSRGMESAWEKIRADQRVMLSVDLFFIGILFFSPEFKVKQQFTIRY